MTRTSSQVSLSRHQDSASERCRGSSHQHLRSHFRKTRHAQAVRVLTRHLLAAAEICWWSCTTALHTTARVAASSSVVTMTGSARCAEEPDFRNSNILRTHGLQLNYNGGGPLASRCSMRRFSHVRLPAPAPLDAAAARHLTHTPHSFGPAAAVESGAGGLPPAIC